MPNVRLRALGSRLRGRAVEATVTLLFVGAALLGLRWVGDRMPVLEHLLRAPRVVVVAWGAVHLAHIARRRHMQRRHMRRRRHDRRHGRARIR